MHQKLEYWFTSDIEDRAERMADVNRRMAEFVAKEGYTEAELRVGEDLFNSLMVCGFFERVESIVEMEDTLYSFTCGGYAGRVDCVYRNAGGENVLLDFKTARRRKSREYIQNYYLQLGAYFVAYYQMHKVKLDHGELWIAVENDSPQLIYIDQSELIESAKQFLGLCKAYHQQYGHLVQQTI